MSTSGQINGQYRGTRGELFPLAISVALLTFVTLGIYRFWGKTRIRKYIWSSTVGDGDAFEYTGTGLEKFLGFLVAIVALAIYLGVVQMLLFFLGLSYSVDLETPQGILALNALIFFNLFASAADILRHISRPPLQNGPYPLAGRALWHGKRRMGLRRARHRLWSSDIGELWRSLSSRQFQT